jgi:hypothetical protein
LEFIASGRIFLKIWVKITIYYKSETEVCAMSKWAVKARILAAVNVCVIILGCFSGFMTAGDGEAGVKEWNAEAEAVSLGDADRTAEDTQIIYELYDGYGYLFYRDASPAGAMLSGLTRPEFNDIMPGWTVTSFSPEEVTLIKVVQ